MKTAGLTLPQAIRSILHLPCAISPMLYVELAAQDIVRTAYTFITPDIKETYHRAVGRSLVCSMKESIVDAHNYEEGVSNGPLGAGTKFLFRSAELVDQAVWWAFVYSVLQEGLMGYLSNIIKLGSCNPRPGQLSFNMFDPFGAVKDSGDFSNDMFVWDSGDPHIGFIAPQQTLAPGWACVIAGQASAVDVNGQDAALQSRIWVEESGVVIAEDTSNSTDADRSNSTVLAGMYHNTFGEIQTVHLQACCPYELEDHEAFPKAGWGFMARWFQGFGN